MEEEAKNLKERFAGINRAGFARDHQLKGGQSMIYQHINGNRPISMEAALVYAKGFGCALEEISPRLAAEATAAAKHLAAPEAGASIDKDTVPVSNAVSAPPEWMSPEAFQLLNLFYALDEKRRRRVRDYIESQLHERGAASGVNKR